MIRSIINARMSMKADVLKPGDVTQDPINPSDYGEWVKNQDPLTGEIVEVWVPYPDLPDTPENENVKFGTIDCIVRGIVDGGIRVAGTTERFGDTYMNMEYLKLWVPGKTVVTKADRITNIRDRHGHIAYLDDEFDDRDPSTTPKATVFNVNGVTPTWDAFNRAEGNFILLERAEI
jgi:hypothetical protein